MAMDYGAEAIKRHRASRGKVSIASKMVVETLEDLSIAYTPGVASVCMAIAEDKTESFHLTNRANTVAVVTDGSAVLGLGNIGAEAAMPVMEGKSILFKSLADIDAIPVCLASQDNDSIIQTVRNLVPSFGGINLEDIAAPRCFYIEDALQDLGIPVFHDDQHGTAIAVLAGVINSLLVTGRKIEETKFVFAGAGAGGIASTKLLLDYGATNVTLVDSTGIISNSRSDLTQVKSAMLETTNPENTQGGLAEALRGADVFIGLSVAEAVHPEMVSLMAKDSIVFAMANPVPGNLARPCRSRRGCRRRHRPQRFPQSDQQQPGVPRSIPRRVGLPCYQGDHPDEAGRRRRSGSARKRADTGECHTLVLGPQSGTGRFPGSGRVGLAHGGQNSYRQFRRPPIGIVPAVEHHRRALLRYYRRSSLPGRRGYLAG